MVKGGEALGPTFVDIAQRGQTEQEENQAWWPPPPWAGSSAAGGMGLGLHGNHTALGVCLQTYVHSL